MAFKTLSFFLFVVFPVTFGYCPQCERNAQFMNLMNQLRPAGNTGSNIASNGVSNNNVVNQPFGTTFGVASNGNSYGQWNANSNGHNIVAVNSLNGGEHSNGASVQNGYSAQSQNYNGQYGNLPIRIINTGGYGCCANNYGPCCNGNGNGFKIINLNSLTNSNTGSPNLNSNHGFVRNERSQITQPDWVQSHTETAKAPAPAVKQMTLEQYQAAQLQQLQQQVVSQYYNNPGVASAYQTQYLDNDNTDQIVVQSW